MYLVPDVSYNVYCVMQARDNGCTTPGEEYDWVPFLMRYTGKENDRPSALYGRGITPFMALNGGASRIMPGARKPSGVEVEKMYAHMYDKQLAVSVRRKQGIQYQVMPIGALVRVRATQTEIKKKIQLGSLTARGIVHGISVKNGMYYVIRWLTDGVGSRTRAAPNQLSQPIYEGSILPFVVDGKMIIASVFEDTERKGDFVEAVRLMEDTVSVLYLNGPEAGNKFKRQVASLPTFRSCPYPTWLEAQVEDGDNAEEQADTARTDSGPSTKRRAGKRAKEDVPPKKTGGGKKKHAAYVNPQQETQAWEYTRPTGHLFVGSDDPEELWQPAASVASRRSGVEDEERMRRKEKLSL